MALRQEEIEEVEFDEEHEAPDPDYDFKVVTICLDLTSNDEWNRQAEELMRAGWWIQETVVCPPYVQYIFQKDLGRRVRRRRMRRNP